MDDGVKVFTEGDIAALRAWDSLIADGEIRAEDEVSHVRAIGQTMSRLADWQVREMLTRIAEATGPDEPARAAGTAELTDTVLPIVESLMSYTWRRHLVAAVGRILASPADELSTATTVIGFADMVGYTSTVRHTDISELAALLERFEENAAETVVSNHGRVVKSLGDEVLFVADTARDAAEIAVRLSRSGAGLPRPAPASGGHGPRPRADQVRRRIRAGGQPGVPADLAGQARDGSGGQGARGGAAPGGCLPAAPPAARRGARLSPPALLVTAPANLMAARRSPVPAGRGDGPHRVDRVRVRCPLVRPVPDHPGEPQRDAAGVPAAGLDPVEGDLHH